MNITLVSDYFPPSIGGMEKHVCMLAEHLAEMGHSVNILTRKIPGLKPAKSKISIYGSPSILSKYNWFMRGYDPPLFDPLFLFSAVMKREFLKNAIVHSHGVSTLSMSPCRKVRNFPFLVTVHDYWPVCFRRNLMHSTGEVCALERDCTECLSPHIGKLSHLVPAFMNLNSMLLDPLNEIDTFVAVSNFVKKMLVKGEIPAKKIQVIYNWIDLNELSLQIRNLPEKKENIALYVGVVSKAKGVHQLIDVAPSIVKEFPDFKLNVVGLGPLLPSLKRKVETEGLSRNVSFLGRIKKSALVDEYRKAKVFICPSIWPEPCSTVILDAMAFKLPIIASDVGGIPELVRNEVNGFLFPTRDMKFKLSDGILTLLSDGDLCERIGENNLVRVKENFSIERQIETLVRVYEDATR